jgi:Hom_end-associated Hint/Homing endonuclease
MEKIENPSLVTLEDKPDLTKLPIVKINFKGIKPIGTERVDEDEPHKSVVKIVNKRKGPEYRENVFKRLALQNIRTGYVDIAEELKHQKRMTIEEEKEKERIEEEPRKIEKKKLVIRNVEFKVPEKQKVQDEDEEVKEKELKEEVEEEKIDNEPQKKPRKEDTEEKEEDFEPEEDDEEGLRRLIAATEKTAEVTEEVTEKPKRGRKPKKGKEAEPEIPVDLTTAIINKMKVTDRLPKEREKRILATSSFYMNNRKIFIQKLSELFKNYRQDLLKNEDKASCEERTSGDFDLLTHQKVVRDYLNLYTPYRGLLLYHGLGAGKCHAKGTPIIMSDGTIKLIENIQVGDLLMGDDSKPRTVLSLARGRDKMYDVIPIKGEKYTVNQEHILCLRASGFPKFSHNNHKSNTNYNIQWIENNEFCSKTFTFNNEKENEKEMKIEAEMFFEKIMNNPETKDNVYEISIKDYLDLSDKKKAFLKGYKIPIEFPEKELSIEPYMIGYWLGDVTSSCSAISCQDSTVLYYYAKNLKKYNLNLNYHGGYTYGITGNGKHDNNSFLNTLKDLKMINNKHIPNIYKHNSRENRLKLLAGLLDSDGWYDIKKCCFEFTQKNETLMNDVVYLSRSLGFACYKSIKNTSWTHKGIKKQGTAFRITISGNGIEEIPTLIPRKKATPRKQIKDVLVTGIRVEYVKEDDYYGFMLDGNCRYLMGDFTVTHNTCTSIAIAEGMKSNKRVFILTPASLKMNFFSEMKKCGDDLYKKNQFWEFVSIDGKPEYVGILSKALSLSTDYIKKHKGAWLVNIKNEPNYGELSSEDQKTLDDQLNEMIRTKYTDINYNGLNMNKLNMLSGDQTRNPFDNAVVVIDEAHNFVSRIVNKVKQNKSKTIAYILYEYLMSAKNARIVLLSGTPIINYPNEIGILFNILRGYIKTWAFTINVKTSEKITTDTILAMFDKENFKTYDFVEYNGNVLSVTRNPFGFVNTKKRGATKGATRGTKLGGGSSKKRTKTNDEKKPKNKTKKVHHKKHNHKDENDDKPSDLEKLEEHDENGNVINYAEENYRKPQDPYEGGGPIFDKYDGVKLDDTGNISDFDFQEKILSILKKNDLEVQRGSIKVTNYKALPDTPETFLGAFVNAETGEVKNIKLFQKRILGLTSYFRSAQEQLLPSFVKTEKGDTYHIVIVPMSQHQFGIYEKIRKEEADRESKNKKRRLAVKNKEELYQISSTYRIFSRAACNFTFPASIERPVPNVKGDNELTENVFDAIPVSERKNVDVYASVDDEENKEEDEEEITETDELKYDARIKKALEDVSVIDDETKKSKYLSKETLVTYSPKFVKVLENLMDEKNEGLHLIYSHFRTIEGIGILKLILEANGFAEFKIRKTGTTWELIELEEDADKPKFVLYTGTETPEEKEIIRNVYNGAWEFVPVEIVQKLQEKSENNILGEVIKIFMITSSGAEGINLKNTRFVHIIEPYWHMVRIDQVVGRARRICSHQDLPENMRTVKVFLYITTLSEHQKTDENHIELRIRDLSRIDNKTPVTTDETLFEISSIKQKTNNQILKAVKETSVDCQLYSSISKKGKDNENLVCFGFGKIETNQFSSYPSFENDRSSKEGLDVETITWEATEIIIDGVKYALNEDTMEVYDHESYQRAKEIKTDLIYIGKLVKDKQGKMEIQ